jgi:GNAT superfamily N-acetyltransferase
MSLVLGNKEFNDQIPAILQSVAEIVKEKLSGTRIFQQFNYEILIGNPEEENTKKQEALKNRKDFVSIQYRQNGDLNFVEIVYRSGLYTDGSPDRTTQFVFYIWQNNTNIGDMYVNENYRRTGIATELLEVIKRIVEQFRIQEFETKSSQGGVAFYKGMGLEEVRERVFKVVI